MTTQAEKVAYVRAQTETGDHQCHWPGCKKLVPPARWGCFKHWNKLPKELKNRIWRAFRPGQEVDKTPSGEYIEIAKEVEAWVHEYEAKKRVAGST